MQTFRQKEAHITQILIVKNNNISHDFYINYCKKLKNLINYTKNNYYASNSLNNNNSKIKWQNINKLINKSNKSDLIINKLSINNSNITNQSDICNNLNTHFANIGVKTADSIPNTNKSFNDYLFHRSSNAFHFFSITNNEINLFCLFIVIVTMIFYLKKYYLLD